VIYYFSDQPNLQSGLSFFWDTAFRKLAHMSEYFVLAFFAFKLFESSKEENNKALIFSFIFAVAAAVFDEYHQSFVIGRSASAYDVAIDAVGAAAFVIMRKVSKRSHI